MPKSRGNKPSRNQRNKARRKIRRELGLTGILKRMADADARALNKIPGAARLPVEAEVA